MPSIILSNVFDYQVLLDTEFSSYLVKQKTSEITRKNYLADLRNFFKWLMNSVQTGNVTLQSNATKPLQSITTEIVELFKRTLVLTKTPTATINRRLSALRMFFQFAMIENKVSDNPMTLVRNIPRNEALNNVSTLEAALAQYTRETYATPTDIDDITSFFSWYSDHYGS